MADYPKLSPAERERLEMLIEECSEVIHEACKALRHGYDCYHPAEPGRDNRARLRGEIVDLSALLALVAHHDGLAVTSAEKQTALERKARYTHHQIMMPRGCFGTLGE